MASRSVPPKHDDKVTRIWRFIWRPWHTDTGFAVNRSELMTIKRKKNGEKVAAESERECAYLLEQLMFWRKRSWLLISRSVCCYCLLLSVVVVEHELRFAGDALRVCFSPAITVPHDDFFKAFPELNKSRWHHKTHTPFVNYVKQFVDSKHALDKSNEVNQNGKDL